MPLFVAEHKHAPEHCPAADPKMAPFLLRILSNESAKKSGLVIHGDAVERGKHHLYVIIEGPSESTVRQYLAPFGQAGTLDIVEASTCEEVVQRGAC